MAAMHGRLTGRPGVVLVTSGPGVGNLTTGLLTATTELDPVIAIGGGVPRSMQLKATHQRSNNIKLMEAATKACMEVVVVSAIPTVIANAFRIAVEPHAGAVFISFPQDISLELTNLSAPAVLPAILMGGASNIAVQQAVNLTNQSKHPVILLGGESSRSDNYIAIRQFIETAKIPVVGTFQAAGVISRELINYFAGRVIHLWIIKKYLLNILLKQRPASISMICRSGHCDSFMS